MVSDFIKRKFETENKEKKQIVEFENLLANNISVILGEPASGKTSQLKQFEKENSEDVFFVELVNIETESNLEFMQIKNIFCLIL